MRFAAFCAGVGLALAAGAASAADFVVVQSSDARLVRGRAVEGGEMLPVGPGATATLMSATGSLVRLRGGPEGAKAPARAGGQGSEVLEGLKVLLVPPEEGVSYGGRRGRICPPAASLTTLEDIATAAAEPACEVNASKALEAYIATHPVAEATDPPG